MAQRFHTLEKYWAVVDPPVNKCSSLPSQGKRSRSANKRYREIKATIKPLLAGLTPAHASLRMKSRSQSELAVTAATHV